MVVLYEWDEDLLFQEQDICQNVYPSDRKPSFESNYRAMLYKNRNSVPQSDLKNKTKQLNIQKSVSPI